MTSINILPNRPTWIGKAVKVEGHPVYGVVEYVAGGYAGVREFNGMLSEWATTSLLLI